MSELTQEIPDRKRKLIEATVGLMIRQGFSDTTVDEICAAAQVTKGSFFHYFTSKEDACRVAMEAWSAAWQGIVDAAHLEAIEDPVARLFALFDVMQGAYLYPGSPFGCLVGTVAQEQSGLNETLRTDCVDHLQTWVRPVVKLLDDAKAARPPCTDFDSTEMAWWLCTFVQGTMLITKTQASRDLVPGNIAHCRTYLSFLFSLPQ